MLGLLNFGFSFAFKNSYMAFADREVVQADPEHCGVPGANVLAFYSIILVLGVGCLLFGYIGIVFLLKVGHIVSIQLCPVKLIACKKKWNKRPLDYSHYREEFDCEVNLADLPIRQPGVTQAAEPRDQHVEKTFEMVDLEHNRRMTMRPDTGDVTSPVAAVLNRSASSEGGEEPDSLCLPVQA